MTCHGGSLRHLITCVVTAFVLLITLVDGAQAATYYLSPTGDNASAGTTPTAPWKTFGYALPRLQPGDTLLLLDGTYTTATTGLPYLNCGGLSRADPSGRRPVRGTRGHTGAPITLRAAQERRAHLQGDGRNVVQLDNCASWVIDGLYVSNRDVQVSGYEGSGIVLTTSQHMVLRRNLVYGPNAYFNSHGIALYSTHHSLVEENEVYYATRHGIINGDGGSPSEGNTLRRNYVHSRDHASMPGGYTCEGSCGNSMGDEGISCYPCAQSIYENNIVERFWTGFSLQGMYRPFHNRYLGNIALSTGEYGSFGFTARAGGASNSADQMPTDIELSNNVVVEGTGMGCTTCKQVQLTNNTILRSSGGYGAAMGSVDGGENGDGVGSVTGVNLLAVGIGSAAFSITDQTTWSFDYVLAFEAPSTGFDSHFTHTSTANPQLGACTVYLPATSPARGAGKDGANLGAEILYRYQDGVLTQVPLWDAITGQFPCGAIVSGVNDVPGASCINVHERLHVGTPDCPLPLPPARGTVVTWQAPAAGGPPARYEVWRQVGAQAPTLAASVPATQLTYTDGQATPDACYSVVATNAAGQAPSAPPVCHVPAPAPPGAPQDVRLAPAGQGR